MASDLKIEIFAYDIFSKLFINIGITKPGNFQIYGDECPRSNSYVEACDMIYYEAMLCRFLSFKTIYAKELTAEKMKSLKSLSDFYDFVLQVCDRDDLFGHFTIFERMFATLAFVLNLCLCIYFDTTNAIDVLNFGHLFWATYFDKFTETFYREGGWEKLKRVAAKYFMFSCYFDFSRKSNYYLNEMKEASVNYHKFKETAKLYECKHVTKLWIKFRINNLENYTRVPLNYQHSIDAYEGELLLEDLKRLCDPHGENFIEVFDKCPTFDSIEEIKTVCHDNLRIGHVLSDQKVTNIHYTELSENCIELKKQVQSERSLSTMETIPYNLMDSNMNLKCNENTFFETDLRNENSLSNAAHSQNDTSFPVKIVNRQFGTDIGNLPDTDILNFYHSSENISLNNIYRNELFPMKNFSSESVERLDDTVTEIASFERSENVPTKCVLSQKSLNPVNKYANTADERLCINKDMDGTASTTNALSVDQIGVSARSENTSRKQVFSTKCFDPENKYANAIYERRDTTKNIDDLRKRNDAVEIRDLLRMILVLGDRQGIEYILSTLHNSEDCPESLQENSTKRKKKPKKKRS